MRKIFLFGRFVRICFIISFAFIIYEMFDMCEEKVEREEVAKVTGTNKDDSLAKAPKKREEKKVYPNDPCPCGSGKKYKQCCGRK